MVRCFMPVERLDMSGAATDALRAKLSSASCARTAVLLMSTLTCRNSFARIVIRVVAYGNHLRRVRLYSLVWCFRNAAEIMCPALVPHERLGKDVLDPLVPPKWFRVLVVDFQVVLDRRFQILNADMRLTLDPLLA